MEPKFGEEEDHHTQRWVQNNSEATQEIQQGTTRRSGYLRWSREQAELPQ